MSDHPSTTEPVAEPLPLVSRSLLLVVVAISVMLVLLAFLAWRVLRAQPVALAVGEPVPSFHLQLIEGGSLTLADLQGQGIVLNFWASWCDPCRDEAPLLEETWLRNRDAGIAVLGVAHLDQKAAALRFIQTFRLTYPNGRDSGSLIARAYGIQGVPETFFIDPAGNLAGVWRGPLTPDALQHFLPLIQPTS